MAFDRRNEMLYLDASKRVKSVDAINLVDSLTHLNGREVTIVGDGAVQASRTVINGAVSLETEAFEVAVGLPYTSELQPMRPEIPMRDGTGQFRQVKVSRVGLTVHDSLGGEIAYSPNGRFEAIDYRQIDDAMDMAVPLKTGNVEILIEARTAEGVDIIIRQRDPLPLAVGAIVAKGDIYGE